MRVIITGQSGTRKRAFAEELRKYAYKRRLDDRLATTASGQRRSPNASRYDIGVYEVEDQEWLHQDFLTFVSDYNESEQCNVWARSLQAINESIASQNSDDVFLLIHASFYRNGRFSSSISWDDLLLFQPDCIITLIDDVYDIWERIEAGPHDTHFSLDEILVWRSVEISNARAIALNLKLNSTRLGVKRIPQRVQQFFGLPIPHFVMSVKHPLETFYRLIFERSKRPIIYASFPITRTRHKPARRDDIDNFRKRLQQSGVIVIDPLTIDELRLAETDLAWLDLKTDEKFHQYQEGRWKLEDPVIEPPTSYKNPFSTLSDNQIKRVVNGIVQQVVDRDFKLVAQCARLVAYRPFYPEQGDEKFGPPTSRSTDGVTREINFALGLRMGVWAFHPRCDWHPMQEENVFSRYSVWNRVRRFPIQSALVKLHEADSSGIEDLLTELTI